MSGRRVLAIAALLSVGGVLVGCSTASEPNQSTASASSTTPTSTPTVQAAPPISIGTPLDGATISVPFLVAGSEKNHDAALTVEAVDAVGNRLCTLNIPATSGTATPGSWQGTVAFPPPDAAELVTLRVYAPSPTDGSPTDLVAQAITVSAEQPPIFLISPACGDIADTGKVLAVTGRAAVFNAPLMVELRNAAGVAVLAQQTVADSCCADSNFGVLLSIPTDLPAGQYDVVAFNVNAADGSKQYEFPVQIQVR